MASDIETNATGPAADISPQTQMNRLGWIGRFNGWIVKYKALVELGAVLVTLAVLVVYWLQLEVSRKQLMNAQVPWLSIENFKIDPFTHSYAFVIVNHSNAPALKFGVQEEYLSKTRGSLPVVRSPTFTGAIVPAQDSKPVSIKVDENRFDEIFRAFVEHDTGIRVTVSYKDVFGRPFELAETFENSTLPHIDVMITDAEFRGAANLY